MFLYLTYSVSFSLFSPFFSHFLPSSFPCSVSILELGHCWTITFPYAKTLYGLLVVPSPPLNPTPPPSLETWSWVLVICFVLFFLVVCTVAVFMVWWSWPWCWLRQLPLAAPVSRTLWSLSCSPCWLCSCSHKLELDWREECLPSPGPLSNRQPSDPLIFWTHCKLNKQEQHSKERNISYQLHVNGVKPSTQYLHHSECLFFLSFWLFLRSSVLYSHQFSCRNKAPSLWVFLFNHGLSEAL